MRKSSVKITFDNFYETIKQDIGLLKKLHTAERVVGIVKKKLRYMKHLSLRFVQVGKSSHRIY
jgi:hypothetical protein